MALEKILLMKSTFRWLLKILLKVSTFRWLLKKYSTRNPRQGGFWKNIFSKNLRLVGSGKNILSFP